MKNMIKILGILLLLAAIGLPLFAQPAPPTASIHILTSMPNVGSSMLQRSFSPGEKHFYRVDNMIDSVYYILWRDEDLSTFITAPFGDIKVSIVNLTTNMVIITGADVNRSLNTDNELNNILLRRGTHYNSGDSILIIVEGVINTDRGNYAIMVH